MDKPDGKYDTFEEKEAAMRAELDLLIEQIRQKLEKTLRRKRRREQFENWRFTKVNPQ